MTSMTFAQTLQRRIDSLTKPIGALGKLERIAFKLGHIQQSLSPELRNPAILVFAADHGIVAENVSAYPKEITYQMVVNFARGGAAINVFARQHGINLRIIDAGVDGDFPADLGIIDAKIARGTMNMIEEPAMTPEMCDEAMRRGAEFVRREYEAGCNIIGFGDMGIGNTSSASLLLHKYSGLVLEDCVGRGAGLDESGLKHKFRILKRIAATYMPTTAYDILCTFGGLEIAMMCGAAIEARKLNMAIVADGFISTSAIIAARNLYPPVLDNTIYSHCSEERGHRLMLLYLRGEPILNLDLRLGEGIGIALAYPILKSAAAFLNEMATFKEAGIDDIYHDEFED